MSHGHVAEKAMSVVEGSDLVCPFACKCLLSDLPTSRFDQQFLRGDIHVEAPSGEVASGSGVNTSVITSNYKYVRTPKVLTVL